MATRRSEEAYDVHPNSGQCSRHLDNRRHRVRRSNRKHQHPSVERCNRDSAALGVVSHNNARRFVLSPRCLSFRKCCKVVQTDRSGRLWRSSGTNSLSRRVPRQGKKSGFSAPSSTPRGAPLLPRTLPNAAASRLMDPPASFSSRHHVRQRVRERRTDTPPGKRHHHLQCQHVLRLPPQQVLLGSGFRQACHSSGVVCRNRNDPQNHR